MRQWIIVFLLGLCWVPSTWAESNRYEMTTAITATESGDYLSALPLWRKMALDGDPVAQYNLALFYQNGFGTAPDKSEADRWFRAAADKGLVQAYNQLSDGTIKPADHVKIAQALQPQDWVMAQNPKYFTLQLASSQNRELIERYIDENNLHGKAGYYRSVRNGKEWYALVYGAFPTVGEANASITQLPEQLRKWSPWVRNIDDIHNIVLRDAGRTSF